MFNAASLSPRVAGSNRGTQAAWWRPGDVKCQHVTQVLAERRHLLLAVAAAKTRARWILLPGFVLAIAGFGFFAAGVIRFIRAVFHEMTNAAGKGRPNPANAFVDPFGVEIFGVPSGLLGWAVAGVGVILMIIGTVLQLMAIGRGRRVERELPLAPPQSTREDPR